MVKSTGVIRKLDELGRIVLPIEARKLLGMDEKEDLEIFVDEEKGHIILEKASKMCLKCQSKSNLKNIKPGFYLCSNCIDELK